MEFSLTEDQIQLQTTAREFAQKDYGKRNTLYIQKWPRRVWGQ